MRALPGVQHAAIALTLPYERALNSGFRWEPGAPSRIINVTYVTPEYFDALSVPVLRGRALTVADAATGAPVAVVNEAFVRRHSADRDPIGRQLLSGGERRTIVGVVGDIVTKTAFGNFGPVGAVPAAYIPAAQTTAATFQLVHTWFSPSWFVRTKGAQAGMAVDMQRAVRAVDPLLPFAKFRTLDEVRGEAVASQRAQALLAGTLAGLALVLAAVGLYGLVASSVAERTRELGVRMALGASPSRAITTAVTPGVLTSVVGIAIGLAAARGAAQALRHLVWGVSVNDPASFAIAASAVFVTAVFAAAIPSLRIGRLDPVRALRV
jgi:hypothetical protein